LLVMFHAPLFAATGVWPIAGGLGKKLTGVSGVPFGICREVRGCLMKKISGFMMAVVIVFAGNSFSVAGDSIGENEDMKNISLVFGKISGQAIPHSVLVESTSVIKSGSSGKGVKDLSGNSLDFSVSQWLFASQIRGVFSFNDGHFVVLASTTGSISPLATFYSSSGDKIRSMSLNRVEVSPNRKYLAGISGGECSLDSRGMDQSDAYMELLDTTGRLLWKRLGYRHGNSPARFGNSFQVSAKGYVAVEHCFRPRITVYDSKGNDVQEIPGSGDPESNDRFVFSNNGNLYFYSVDNSLSIFSIDGNKVFDLKMMGERLRMLGSVIGSDDFIFSSENEKSSEINYYHFDALNRELVKIGKLPDMGARTIGVDSGNGLLRLISAFRIVVWSKDAKQIVETHNLIALEAFEWLTATVTELFLIGDKILVMRSGAGAQYTDGSLYVLVFDSGGNKLNEVFFKRGKYFRAGNIMQVNDKTVALPVDDRMFLLKLVERK